MRRTLRLPRPLAQLRLRLATFGHLCFLIGSVLFLDDATVRAGVWLFIAGSSAFLVAGAIRDRD